MLSCIFGRCSSETYVVNKLPRTASGTNGVIKPHVDPDHTIVEVEERNNNQVNTQEQVRTPQGAQNGHVTQVPEEPSHSEADARNTPERTTNEQSSKYNGESSIGEKKGQTGKSGDIITTIDKKGQGSKSDDKSTIGEKNGQGSKHKDKSITSEEKRHSSKYENESTTSEKNGQGSKPDDISAISEEKGQSGKYEDRSTTSEKKGQGSKPNDKNTVSEKREQSSKSKVTPAVKESETQAKSKVKAPQPPGISQTQRESAPSVTNGERRSIQQIEEVIEEKLDDNEQEEVSSKVTKRRSGIVPLPVKYDETAQIKFKISPKTEK